MRGFQSSTTIVSIKVMIMIICLNFLTNATSAQEKVEVTTLSGKAVTTVALENTTPISGQSFQGIGAEVFPTLQLPSGTEMGMTEGDFQLFKSRSKKMGVSFVRVWAYYDWWCRNETEQFETPEMQGLYAHLAHYTKTGTDVMLHALPGGHSTVDQWAEHVRNLLVYIHDTKGYTAVKYISIFNEPNQFDPKTSLAVTVQYYNTLKAKLTTSGINYIKVIGSDLTRITDVKSPFYTVSQNWFQNFIKAAQVDIYSIHDYMNSDATYWNNRINDKNTLDSNGFNKGAILAEFGVWDGGGISRDHSYGEVIYPFRTVVQAMNQGFTGFSKWTLFDSFVEDAGGANQTSSNQTGDDKSWGLWRSRSYDWSPRQGFYSYSLLTKFSRIGSTIYKANSNSAKVSASILKLPGGDYSVFVVNENTNSTKIDFNFTNSVNKIFYKFNVTTSTSIDPWATLLQPSGTIGTVTTGFSDTISANSVAVYTSAWYPGEIIGSAGTVQITHGKVPSLSWTNSANALYYRVYRDITSSFTPSPRNQVGESADGSFVDEKLGLKSKTFYYKIISVGSYEQTGPTSRACKLNHKVSLTNKIIVTTTDGGRDYSIVSDGLNGYIFKINKRAGVGKYIADPAGVQKNSQMNYNYSIPRIINRDSIGNATTPVFEYGLKADSVSSPSTQADGSVKVTVTKGRTTLSYQFYPDHIRISITGSANGFHIEDMAYQDMQTVKWGDGTTSDLTTLADLGNVTKNTSSLTLNQTGSAYGVKYGFDSSTPLFVYKTPATSGSKKYVAFNISNGGSYNLSIPFNN